MPGERKKYMRRVEESLLGLVLFTIVVYWPLLWVTSEDIDPSLGAFAILVVFVGVLFGPRVYRNYRRAQEAETTPQSGDASRRSSVGDEVGDGPE